MAKIDVELQFAWYDLWVGIYVRKSRVYTRLFICLIPCFPIVIGWDRQQAKKVRRWPG